MRRWFDRVLNALSICALVAIAYAMLRPGGMIREDLVAWVKSRQERAALRTRWVELVGAGTRLGRSGGRVVAVEFADYECPYCRRIAPAVDSLLEANDSISIVFVHLPLSIHPAARGAAKASICAEEQGHFEAMHRDLMTSDQWERDTNWVREATAAGVSNLDRFAHCLASPETEARVRHDAELGEAIGAVGTPTFATPVRKWSGAVLPAGFWLHDGH